MTTTNALSYQRKSKTYNVFSIVIKSLFRFPAPHCRWFQRDTYIFLTVEVMDCQEPDISVMDNKLVFTCTGDDMKKYELDIELLQDISSKVVK